MLKSKLAALGWGSRESLPSLSSWILALILGALLLLDSNHGDQDLNLLGLEVLED